jgi:ribosomal protein L37E
VIEGTTSLASSALIVTAQATSLVHKPSYPLEDHMPKCKLGCGREAVTGPWRKRYCAPCGENYLRKQREYQIITATLPMCATRAADDCTGKLSKTRFDAGDTSCLQCQRLVEEQTEIQEEDQRKRTAFEAAETVEGLKAWIEEYLL